MFSATARALIPALILATASSPDLIPVGKYRDWIGATDIFALAPVEHPHAPRPLDPHTACGS